MGERPDEEREGNTVMVGAWIGIVVGLLLVSGGIYSLVTLGRRNSYEQSKFKLGGIAAILIGAILAGSCAFWLYGTEAGARARKSFQSSTGGGLTRVVTVYDMEGDQINQYKGKFDVDANEKRIIFDMPQPDGSYKRVQIWQTNGTVTIEEK